MSRAQPLPLERPVAVTGAREGIWIADAASASAVLFDAASAAILSRLEVPASPVALATAGDLVAVAIEGGDVIAFSGEAQRWRRATGPGRVELKAGRDRIWAWSRGGSFAGFDAEGREARIEASGATAFAPADAGVYSLTAEALVFTALDGGSRRAPLPEGGSPDGGLVVCANALWVSAAGGLHLVALDTLLPRARLTAPEGPVPHLVCFHGRLFGGGSQAVFALEPAADDNARSLGVRPASPLLGLGVSGTHLWAVESGSPLAHIVRIP